MKRHWTLDDLVEHFTLLPREHAMIASLRGDHTRLGLAVLLKSFRLDGRFPSLPHEVPASVVDFLANQLNVAPTAFAEYDWWGRTIDGHRNLIRATYAVRAWTNADAPALITHLTEELLQTHSRDPNRLRASAQAYCRTQGIEPPSGKKMERALLSAFAAYDEGFCTLISARLSDSTKQHLDRLLTTVEPAQPDVEAPDPAASRRALLHILRRRDGRTAPLQSPTPSPPLACNRWIRVRTGTNHCLHSRYICVDKKP